MAYRKRSYLEHVAFRVKDIQWYIQFFKETLGMSIVTVDGPAEDPNQVWIRGGLQLISDPSFDGPQGKMGHIAIVTEDLELALQEVYAWGGVTESPRGRNWVQLPDELLLELIQAKKNSVSELLNVEVSYV